MTLAQVIHQLEVVASHQPSVNMLVQNDIFRLNAAPEVRYGVFAWTQGQHYTSPESDIANYQFTVFYVDRLTADRSNQIEVQSVGLQTIGNIVNDLCLRDLWISGVNYQTFNQRFLDECAGVFANITIQAPARSLCPENFADFNNDFNDDFLIY